MLFLLLQAGTERYAVDIGPVIEVVPFVTLKAFPRAPREIAGIMDYRGCITPVIDLTVLLGGQPSRPLMSTRIIMVQVRDPAEKGAPAHGATGTPATEPAGKPPVPGRADHAGKTAPPTRIVGLLAEKVIETVRYDEAQLQPSHLGLVAAPYLGEILSVGGEMIQRLRVDRLVPERLMASLFPADGATA